jgi:hypothetical protein
MLDYTPTPTPTPTTTPPPPPLNQSFCATTRCSGHGTCNELAQACLCEDGYTGVVCQKYNSTNAGPVASSNSTEGNGGQENSSGGGSGGGGSRPKSCDGPRDVTSTCCGTGSVLTPQGTCCSPVSVNTTVNGTTFTRRSRPRLTPNGTCCPSGNVNVCGVCDGPKGAVLSAAGGCCPGGVLDAGGLCCASGTLDSFGVCDGTDATGTQQVTLAVNASGVVVPGNGTITSADLADPASPVRIAVEEAVKEDVATKLDRDPS